MATTACPSGQVVCQVCSRGLFARAALSYGYDMVWWVEHEADWEVKQWKCRDQDDGDWLHVCALVRWIRDCSRGWLCMTCCCMCQPCD